MTGVQTCALPICAMRLAGQFVQRESLPDFVVLAGDRVFDQRVQPFAFTLECISTEPQSLCLTPPECVLARHIS